MRAETSGWKAGFQFWPSLHDSVKRVDTIVMPHTDSSTIGGGLISFCGAQKQLFVGSHSHLSAAQRFGGACGLSL